MMDLYNRLLANSLTSDWETIRSLTSVNNNMAPHIRQPGGGPISGVTSTRRRFPANVGYVNTLFILLTIGLSYNGGFFRRFPQ